MRRYGMVLAALLGTAMPVLAQATPPTAAGPPAGALDKHLLKWEQAMRKVTTLKAENITRIDKDKAFGTTTKYVGWAEYMKVGTGASALNLASLELKRER